MPKAPTCGHSSRRVFSRGDCAECAQRKYAVKSQQKQREKRTQTPPSKINPDTALTRTLRKIYQLLRAELLPLHTACQGHGKITGCTGKATEVHHCKGRRGFLIILSRHFRYLCKNCHDFCTENSAAAKELGLSEQINSKTEFEFTEREKELICQFGIKLPKNAN